MGPEVNAVDITGISLGDKVVLQLVALTNHPVGKLERALLEIEKDDSPRQQGIVRIAVEISASPVLFLFLQVGYGRAWNVYISLFDEILFCNCTDLFSIGGLIILYTLKPA